MSRIFRVVVPLAHVGAGTEVLVSVYLKANSLVHAMEKLQHVPGVKRSAYLSLEELPKDKLRDLISFSEVYEHLSGKHWYWIQKNILWDHERRILKSTRKSL